MISKKETKTTCEFDMYLSKKKKKRKSVAEREMDALWFFFGLQLDTNISRYMVRKGELFDEERLKDFISLCHK